MTSKKTVQSERGRFTIQIINYHPSHGVNYPTYTINKTYNRVDGIGWQIKVENVNELRELHAALGKLITEANERDTLQKSGKEHVVDRFNDLDM